jgi:hypothetical protein
MAASRRPGISEADNDGGEEFPTFGDVVRLLYRQRVRLSLFALAFLSLGLAGLAAWHFSSARTAEGRLLLTFAGLERREYPSGARFSAEDIRSAEVLRGAVQTAGLVQRNLDLSALAAGVQVLPVVPAEVLARWKKADRDGVKREEFVPSEFDVVVASPELGDAEKLRLFDAIVQSYQARVKHDQRVRLRFVSASKISAQDLIDHYDYWDIPQILSENMFLLAEYVGHLVDESREYKDSLSQYSFRDVETELSLWGRMRLEPLKALTYRRQLVKDKETALLAAQYRMRDLAIQTGRLAAEEASALRLLEAAQKPASLAVSDASSRAGIPIVDQPVIDRLMAGEYLAPLVQRISILQQRIQKLETERLRLERDMELLPGAHDVRASEVPANYHELLATSATELSAIVERYNRLLDDYTSATIEKQVTVTAGPRTVRSGGSPAALVLGLAAIAVGLSVGAVWIEHALSARRNRR